jgi:oxygen-independent coproporphyrinogen-3 oxidase
LHIPFCARKCHYCDFNTYAGMLAWRDAYVTALAAEIGLAGERARQADGRRRRCRTVYLGGGTPSLLAPEQVALLLAAAQSAFDVDACAEVSLEANPATVERGQLGELRAAGVNRLSIGAQSFDAQLLRWLWRTHTPEEVVAAVVAARAAGFTNINLDFMYAMPGQSLETWAATIAQATDLRPDHLSLYSLIVEENTPLHTWVSQGRVRPADDDVAADMYELAVERLARAGYHHYEISNWALPGSACHHNLTYWQNLPYIGLGAGAHGWYGGRRYVEARAIPDYVAKVRASETPVCGPTEGALPAAAIVEDELLSGELEMAETAMLGLRLSEGVLLDAFKRRFGHDFATVFGARLAEVRAAGLIDEAEGSVRLTARGRLLGNEVFERLLPEEGVRADTSA